MKKLNTTYHSVQAKHSFRLAASGVTKLTLVCLDQWPGAPDHSYLIFVVPLRNRQTLFPEQLRVVYSDKKQRVIVDHFSSSTTWLFQRTWYSDSRCFLFLPPSAPLCYLQVCKYFLDAIENNKYGWFWVCPGGGDNCMYRHALPPGFVLKKDKKKEEKEEEISLEELIENEVSIYWGIWGLFGNLQLTDLRNK